MATDLASYSIVSQLAHGFSENKLWHPVEKQLRRLALVNDQGELTIDTNCSLLDAGCGRNQLVKYLREKGFVHVCGVDVRESTDAQNPDIIGDLSSLSSFAGEKSYEYVVAHWSSIYPLAGSPEEEWPQNIIIFLHVLLEMIKTSSKFVVIHPFGESHLWDLTNQICLGNGSMIINIDFKALFDKMNIKYEVVHTSLTEVAATEALPTLTLRLDVLNADVQPLLDLINRVDESGGEGVVTRPQAIKTPEFYEQVYLPVKDFYKFRAAVQRFIETWESDWTINNKIDYLENDLVYMKVLYPDLASKVDEIESLYTVRTGDFADEMIEEIATKLNELVEIIKTRLGKESSLIPWSNFSVEQARTLIDYQNSLLS